MKATGWWFSFFPQNIVLKQAFKHQVLWILFKFRLQLAKKTTFFNFHP